MTIKAIENRKPMYGIAVNNTAQAVQVQTLVLIIYTTLNVIVTHPNIGFHREPHRYPRPAYAPKNNFLAANRLRHSFALS